MMVKQVIVIRKDLKMRRGKEIAQGSHASMQFMVNAIKRFFSEQSTIDNQPLVFSGAEQDWMDGAFTKVCLVVNSEEELQEIHNRALSAGLEVNTITDLGATEFHGVPTKTCLAIGPDYAEKIDPVTGDLKLY